MASKAPRKKKTSVPTDVDDDAAEQRKRDKKRVQNRLSQQCYREKQASYIKQLERFVENVQAAGSGSADIPSQLQEMQRKQLRLMKENQELREAILRMRKKLLSLSTAASTSADDVIFERILNAPTDDDNHEKTEEGASQEPPAMTEVQNPFPMPFATSAIPTPSEPPSATTPDSMIDPLSIDNSNAISSHIPIPIPPPAPLTAMPLATSVVDDRDELVGGIALRFNTSLVEPPAPSIPIPAPLSTPYFPSRESFRLDPADYSDLVMEETEKSVRDAMARMRFGFFRDAWSQWTVSRQLTPQQIEEIDHMTLSDLCRIAFRILLKASALEGYVYAGGTVPVVEKVLRWRISPSAENRATIDEPFRPTPLQQLVHSRHPSIDYIHWGELRDQLIIYMGAYNMQTLILDTLQFLVREVPQLNIAIPVLEFYKALAASSESSDSGPSESIAFHYSPLVSYNPNSQATLQLVKKFGIDRVLERKLMPGFAQKYPFLDISSSRHRLTYAEIEKQHTSGSCYEPVQLVQLVQPLRYEEIQDATCREMVEKEDMKPEFKPHLLHMHQFRQHQSNLQRTSKIEMPKLKQLLCSVERADSGMPFREYGTCYGDGFVQTHIAVPATPVPFTLHLSSTGYIAPGLAMFVFMDGVYQCNRNVDGLVPPSEGTEKSQTEIDFRVRQKEQILNDDIWIAREWRFEKFNIVTEEPHDSQHASPPDITHLGYIEVVVLRCLNFTDSTIASPLNPASAAPSKGDMPRIPRTGPSSSTLGGLFFDGAADYHLPKCISFGYDGTEAQSTRSESKTVRFGEDESRYQMQDEGSVQWDYLYTGPDAKTWHTMDGSYDRGHRRGRFLPEETWERRTQAYEHYHEDWRNPDGQFNETKGYDTPQDTGYHNHPRYQNNIYNRSRARPPAVTERGRRAQPEGRGRSKPEGTFVVGSGSATYRPSRLGPQGLQGYDSRYWCPNKEFEASEQNNYIHGMQDQYDRSGYGENHGNWDGGESRNRGIGCTSNSRQSHRKNSQPASRYSPVQEQPADPETWKAPLEWNDGNHMEDGKHAPQGNLRDDCDIRQPRNPDSRYRNTWNPDVGPDVNGWVINDGSGTWKPPAGNETDLRRANRHGRNVPDPPVENTNFNITHVGGGTWTNPGAKDQPMVGPGNRYSDANCSNQGGGNIVHPSRENSGNYGAWKNDDQLNQQSNMGEGEDGKQGGNKPSERGNIEGNWGWGGTNGDLGNQGNTWKDGGGNNDFPKRRSKVGSHGYNDENWGGGRAKDGQRNKERIWKEGGSNRDDGHFSNRGGNKSNGHTQNDENWNGGKANDDHGNQEITWKGDGYSRGNFRLSKWGGSKANECEHAGGNGGGNGNRPNNGRAYRSWEGENTNHQNVDQEYTNSEERRNKDRPKGEGSGQNRGSTNSNPPNAYQGYSNTIGGGNGNNSNHGMSRRGGGRDGLLNHGRENYDGNSRKDNRSSNGNGTKGRGGNDGKSNRGGSRWGGSGVTKTEHPARPSSGANEWRASGSHTKSNQGDKTASHEISNQNDKDGGWGGGETGQGHGKFNTASINDGRGNGNYHNTGEGWSGDNGNNNNGEALVGNPNSDRLDTGNNGMDWNASGSTHDNAEGWRSGINEPGTWNGGGYEDPNSNTANGEWGNTGNENEKGDNVGLDVFSYQTNKKSDIDTYKANENDPAIEESLPLNNSPLEPGQPYAKPYWSSWEAELECIQSPAEPNSSRKRSDSFRIGDESPLYSVHKEKLRDHSASHQVHHGTPAYYARKLRKPIYLDSMEEPYAVFVFKYRSRKALEALLKVPVACDEEDEKARLMRLSKDEIIEELLRLKLETSAESNEGAGEEKNPIVENSADGSGGVGGETGGGEW